MKRSLLNYFFAILGIVAITSSGLCVSDVLAQRDSIEPIKRNLEDAKIASRLKDYNRAYALLESGLQDAKEARNTKLESAFHFQLAVTLQQRAAGTDLTKAISHYEEHLKLDPASGGALNNLAQLYSREGKSTESARLYQQAIALNDERKGFYALNLADLYMEQGNVKTAARYYKITLDSNPDHPEAQEGLIAAYQDTNLPGLVSHLWAQIDKGREVRAVTAALQVLDRLKDEADRSGLEKEKTELLTCVVVGLSKAQYGPLTSESKGAKKDEVEQALQNLADDPHIGEGVREVLQAYDNPAVTPDQSWWADRGLRYEDPEEGWWPRDGYRMLLRSLGIWYERREWFDTAEAYFMASINLTETGDNEPDLEALVRLADIYMQRGEIERVRELLDGDETELFFGKGQAYKTSSWNKVYAFHRTLGIMYALTENWGSSGDVTSATFQLENALDKRRIYNNRIASRENLPPIALEPRLVHLLVQTYNATGRADEAVQLQLESATELVKEDRKAGARQILKEIDTERLNNEDRRVYRTLMNRAQ